MAKLHLPGDWAPPLVFGFAGVANTLAGTLPGQTVAGIGLMVLAFLLGIAAFRGREIQEQAVYYYWKALETSFATVLFSALLLFFGINVLLAELSLYMVFLSLGFFTFAYYFSVHARITIFNKDKTFLTMIGKPWSFTRRYQAKDFQSLTVSTDFSYAGQLGMIQSWQRHYFIFATKGRRKVLLLRDNSKEEMEQSLLQLSQLTGLPIVAERPEETPLAPGLRVEIVEPLSPLGDSNLGTVAELKKKNPTARVVQQKPAEFTVRTKKKKPLDRNHFVALLKAAKVPYYFHASTPDQTEVWYFKHPLIVPLQWLTAFEGFEALSDTPNEGAVLFTAYRNPEAWEEFTWVPDTKYPPLDADEDTRWWWGRQGKDKR